MARLVIVLAIALGACTPTVPSTPVATQAGSPSAASMSPMATTTPPQSSPIPSAGAELGGAITVRYPDGLPMWMGGSFVHRGGEAIDFARGRIDTTPFLVTGWATFRGQPVSCPIVLDGSSWQRECIRVRLTDVAGTVDGELTDATTFRDLLATGSPPPPFAPLVVVAHARDPRSSQCAPEPNVCAAMIVVERVLWHGDAATDPGPITAADAAAAVSALQDVELEPEALDMPAGACDRHGLYPFVARIPDNVTPVVTCADIGPTTEALRRAIDQPEGVDAALRPNAVLLESRGTLHGVVPSHVTYRWLVIENVAFLVRTQADPTRKDRVFLEKLMELLRPPA